VDSLIHECFELLSGVVRGSSLLLVSRLLVFDVVLRVRPLLTKAHGGKAPWCDMYISTAGLVTRPSRLVDPTIDPDDLLHPGYRGVDGAIQIADRHDDGDVARPVVKTMAVQPPRNLPKLLACVRIHDREVRTYELIKRFPRRGLSCKYHTIVFWDEGCTEIKNSTDFAFEADRFQEYRVQDERIAHLIQTRDDQFDRTRRANQAKRAASNLDDLHLTSALVVTCIKVDQFVHAARVIQRNWRQYLHQRQLPGGLVARNRTLELLLSQTDDPGARVISESSSDDDEH
jgi:hypothetical protein